MAPIILVGVLIGLPALLLVGDLLRLGRKPADRFAGDPHGPRREAKAREMAATAAASNASRGSAALMAGTRVRDLAAAQAAPAAAPVAAAPFVERRQQSLPFVGTDRRIALSEAAAVAGTAPAAPSRRPIVASDDAQREQLEALLQSMNAVRRQPEMAPAAFAYDDVQAARSA
ncbi:hypothetical protein DSM112329_02336 [Paraconexibacter sp. AEG42_29]|uniref:Uncharacterized protein n=1 Tax=Paraconexibacter sp. AEG42_29 TaxID=2997339 RepID=A0AAU7AVH3_9ACTN